MKEPTKELLKKSLKTERRESPFRRLKRSIKCQPCG